MCIRQILQFRGRSAPALGAWVRPYRWRVGVFKCMNSSTRAPGGDYGGASAGLALPSPGGMSAKLTVIV
eukprot:COSAG02_NODE_50211_length_322_cov_0.587444_1_plen_68_part_10